MKTVALISAFLLAVVFQPSGSQGWRYRGRFTKILYTVENTITPDVFCGLTRAFQPKDSPFLKYMDQAAKKSDVFKFKCQNFEKLGCYVVEINGLAANQTASTFWAFIKRDQTKGDCLQNVGVSTYIPQPNEHMVMSFKTYDIFNVLPNCETGVVESHF